MMSIKDDPELRHFLIHVLYALEELIDGERKAARYEVDSIYGLVSWDDDLEAWRSWVNHHWKGGGGAVKKKCKGKKKCH